MSYLWDGFQAAIGMLVRRDPEVIDAAVRSIWISSLAVAIAALIGIPLGWFLIRSKFAGRKLLITAFRAGMAFPTVFIGIVCFALLARNGPMGPLELLYTPWGIVLGEFMLAVPIVVSLSAGAIKSLDPRIDETSRMLGLNPLQRLAIDLSESRTGILLAILTSFARCVTELGIAMMVGGNIKDQTRTLATATAMETGKGEFAVGLAMGLVLLLIALTMMVVAGFLTREEE